MVQHDKIQLYSPHLRPLLQYLFVRGSESLCGDIKGSPTLRYSNCSCFVEIILIVHFVDFDEIGKLNGWFEVSDTIRDLNTVILYPNVIFAFRKIDFIPIVSSQ